jgi:hypothetical protein
MAGRPPQPVQLGEVGLGDSGELTEPGAASVVERPSRRRAGPGQRVRSGGHGAHWSSTSDLLASGAPQQESALGSGSEDAGLCVTEDRSGTMFGADLAMSIDVVLRM